MSNIYSRVIITKNGTQKRLCSLHLNLNLGDLFIEFKRAYDVVAQGIIDTKKGTLNFEDPEVSRIQHLHYVAKEHKMIVTERRKEGHQKHNKGIPLSFRKLKGKTLTLLTRIIPRDEDLLISNKKLTPLDFLLKIPKEAFDKLLAFDIWFGNGFDLIQIQQVSHYTRKLYEKYETKFHICSFGEKDFHSVYIVMYEPKNLSRPNATRIIIPRSIKKV